MLIASFLPWYRVSFFGTSASINGWEAPGAFFSILAVLVAVVLAGAILAPKFGNVVLPNLGSITWGQAFLGGGIAVVALVVLKFINESSFMSFGFYLGFLAAAAVAAGGYLLYTEEQKGLR